VTPTLKLKRAVVTAHYQDLLQDIYSSNRMETDLASTNNCERSQDVMLNYLSGTTLISDRFHGRSGFRLCALTVQARREAQVN